jgi:hypothetical protein
MNDADNVIVIWSRPHVSFGAETPEGCQWTDVKEHPPVFLCDKHGTVLTFKSHKEVLALQLFEAENLDDLLDYDEAGIYITTLRQCKERNADFNIDLALLEIAEISLSKSNKNTTVYVDKQPAKKGRTSNIFSIVKD